jgi:uncharacterized DUF497 family protein
MDFEESQHASRMIERRDIDRNWIEVTLEDPDLVQPDEDDSSLEHRLRVIPEYGGRVLRVIINTDVEPIRLVTAFFDRTMKGEF